MGSRSLDLRPASLLEQHCNFRGHCVDTHTQPTRGDCDMSLLGTPKAKTHKGMDMAAIMRMAGEIEDIAEDGQVSASDIEDRAIDLGVPAAKLYAGLGLTPALSMRLEHATQVVVCTGGCQNYGALPCLNHLVDVRQARLEDDKSAFDIVPRNCLDRCLQGPVVELRSPAGTAVITDASPDLLDEALVELLDA